MLDVCLLGTSGMMPLPRRGLTALMTRLNGSSLLIDCGEGTQVAIRERGWSFHDIDTICFTHYHGDHISGLPGLLLSMGNAERKEPVTLVGPRGLERVVNALRVIAPELPFALNFVEIGEPFRTININGYEIEAFRVKHNVTCYGYTIHVRRGGRFLPEQAMERKIPQKYWGILQRGETVTTEEGITYTPDMVLGPARKGIKVTYCTDSRPLPVIAEQAKNADIFICEGMYGEPDKQAKAVENKHMTFYEAAELARTAQPAEMWLTHYSPSLTHPENYKDKVREIFPRTVIPKEKRSVTLEFDKNE